MSSDPRPPAFRAEMQAIGSSRDGAAIRLLRMTREAAEALGPPLAAIDPWARVNYKGEDMTNFLAATEAGAARYAIHAGGALAGTIVVRNPWLHGPYLHLIGLLPAYHGQGIGSAVLGWLEAEARGRYRNVWLCVSAFNDDARRLYERQGYVLAGRLDSLVFDGLDELLMRKRLLPGALHLQRGEG